jgi:hypothetical protein
MQPLGRTCIISVIDDLPFICDSFMQLDDERRIIEQAQTDAEAFGAIFDEYYPKILA